MEDNLNYHKEIVEITNLTKILSDSLLNTVETFLIEQKELDEKIKIDVVFNGYIRFFSIMLIYFESLGVSIKETLTLDDLNKSKEIVDLEDKFNTPDCYKKGCSEGDHNCE